MGLSVADTTANNDLEIVKIKRSLQMSAHTLYIMNATDYTC